MKYKGLLIAAAVGIAYYLYTAKEFTQNVKVRLAGIKFNDSKSKKNLYTQLWIDIGLIISNPSNFETTINSIALDLYFNGKKIGTVEKYGAASIKPMSENTIIVPAVIPTFSLFATISEAIKVIQAAFKKESKSLTIGVKGIIKTTQGTINIDQSTSITPF